MGTASYGARKNERRAVGSSLKGMIRTCGKLFLDSGAHSLYNEHTLGKPAEVAYKWYLRGEGKLSENFRRYLDDYADFVNEHLDSIDHYVTVDAIYNADISWLAFEYLRRIHAINPMPVIHHRTRLHYIERYLKEGCRIIGIGGLGQKSTRQEYTKWGDRVFQYLCPAPDYVPIVRTHGFAMTSYPLILRYPWWSVDSSSWAKAAGYGMILVPHRRLGKFSFQETPYSISMSNDSPAASIKGRHYKTLSEQEQLIVQDWLNKIGVPLGSVDGEGKTVLAGALSEYNSRAVANLRFFTEMAKSLGDYPRTFRSSFSRSHADESYTLSKPVRQLHKPVHTGRPMHIAFSGGSPIPECNLAKPTIMLSAFVNAKNWKPDSRLRQLMELRSK